ncbi:hypothetical protein GCM10027191_26660 [Novilysobacter erysipheiresistens]
MPDGGDSLVLPIAPDCWPPPRHGVEIDGVAFTPKPELHITVIGNRLGRELREVFAAAWLRVAVAVAFDALDWRYTSSGRTWLLRKSYVEDGRLRVAHSIIERVELPAMAPFHRELERLLGRQLPVPPPHVTLYVAERAQGIGVSSAARLRAFAVREVHGLL